MSKTVVVTGFGPFSGHKTNASSEAVKELVKIGLDMENINLVTMEMPVQYEQVSQIVPTLWDEHKPVLVIHVGVHGYAVAIHLEECARNGGHLQGDIDGCHPDTGCCIDGGSADELHCKLDLDAVCATCEQKAADSDLKVVFKKSHDAGRYLCNFSYYRSLALDRAPSLFVHVPPLDMPFSCHELALALKLIVQTCLSS